MSLCTACGSWDTKTLATRKDTRYNWIWRSKRCNECGHKFATYELPTECITEPEPINPDGRLVK